MKTSVALATYNGEKYLPQLLDSLIAQTRGIDEVIVCDDRSTDGTIAMLESFIDQHGLSNWHVHVNEENMGWRKNFRQAIDMCDADIVFTCDQDDIWEPTKIEECVGVFEDTPDALLLVTNLSGITPDGRGKVTLLQGNGRDDGSLEKKELKTEGLQHHRPGCVFCFRKDFYDILKPHDLEDQPHDSMLWKMAILLDGAYLLNRKLIKYRLHDESADSGKKNTLRHRIARVNEDMEICTWAMGLCDEGVVDPSLSRYLSETLSFSKRRLALLEQRALPGLVAFQFKNRRLYPTWLARIQDVLYAARG